MKIPEEQRIKAKLSLWQSPGFYQFINDLDDMKGVECSLKREVESLRLLYINKLKQILPKGKFIQLKIKGL